MRKEIGTHCRYVMMRCFKVEGTHTSGCNKLQVMRHRRVVDKGICDHLVCFVLVEEDA
jgi:hypothetical protein